MKKLSLFPEWLAELTLQQQAVLVAAVRGQDGDWKETGFKVIASALRASFMRAAHTGKMPAMGENLASFMSLVEFADVTTWTKRIRRTLEDEGDGAYLHYYTHLMHAAQILAYKHPDPDFRLRWKICYSLMVEKLHLIAESESEMDARLGDFNRAEREAMEGDVDQTAQAETVAT